MRPMIRLILVPGIVLALSACGGPKKEEAPPPQPAPEQKAEPAPAPEPAPATVPPAKIPWSADLASNPPKGLAPVPVPVDNPVTPDRAELGRQLYFDKRLSSDGTISCASCHNPAMGFSNGVRFAPGVGGKLGGRNSPTIYNAAYGTVQFWDGRARTLEEQALGPVQNPIEMANTIEKMVTTVSGIGDYAQAFEKAFGPGPITPEKVAMAIAGFERTIISGDAPYDRFKVGDQTALSEAAQRGLAVFEGKGRCVVCHLGPSFMDNQFHNLGVGTEPEVSRGAGAESESAKPDAGRMDFTKEEKDWAKFKTPTLRNVALTAPYMHDGSEPTIESVVALYNKGGIANKNLDPLIQPLQLTPEEQADLVTFLKEGLTREIEVPEPALPPSPMAAPAAEAPSAPQGEAPAAPAPQAVPSAEPAAPEAAPPAAPEVTPPAAPEGSGDVTQPPSSGM